MKQFHIMFTEKQYKRIRTVSYESEKSMAQVVRDAVDTILFEWDAVNKEYKNKSCNRNKESNP